VTPLWFQALIGAGGAIVGALVGGLLVIWAGTRQWRRDRADATAERSHAAAKSILASLGNYELAVIAWQQDYKMDALLRAKDAFTLASLPELPLISDYNVTSRIFAHTEFGLRLIYAASTTGFSGARPADRTIALAKAFQRHGGYLVICLVAHIQGNKLPPYQRPPLDDDSALIDWTPPEAPPPKLPT
jgi:hypothetical protein